MEKLWQGRTDGAIDAAANDFNSSIRFDQRMVREDIAGSVAHAKMLGKTGIISGDESEKIVDGLAEIAADIDAEKIEIDPAAEDIHTFIELQLTARIGDVGKKLHTARSRNDQVALDMRMVLAGASDEIAAEVKVLIEALLALAAEHAETIMPGYTHMQRAQPVTFGQHLLAYAAMFLRDLERLADAKKRTLSMPLGAGALAGTTYPIDRGMVADLLGFNDVAFNSMDAVSDRDFVIETVFALSLVMAHLSRLAEEIVLWSSFEFRFIALSDAFSTGSSIMPQKKNPDIAELIRGKTGRVYGSLIALLTMVKGLPLAYNKDMQEDKEAAFDALDTAKACLSMMAKMFGSVRVNRDRMYRAAAKGFLNATDLADYLTKKGMPFRDAYKISGRTVAYADENDKALDEVSLDELKTFSELFESDVYDAIKLENCVKRRSSEGGTSPESVKRQIEIVKARLADG